jgi:RNA polymerase sigma factor (TIGR02999 family)
MSEPPALPDDANIPLPTRRIAVELMPIFYQDIRRLARRERRRVSAGVTMQTTALVHEAYLKLHGSPEFNNREHFLRAAALAMRHVLVSHARERLAAKRGGGEKPVPLDEAPEVAGDDDAVLLEINEALERLAQINPRLAYVVECRFFAGFDDSETAIALGLTDRTVRRDWIKARAWLSRELGQQAQISLTDPGSAGLGG